MATSVAYDPNKSFVDNMGAQTANVDWDAVNNANLGGQGPVGGRLVYGADTPRTATNSWGDADIQNAAKQLYGAMQTMTANGNEAGAKALYKQKQAEFGFTDEQFSPIAKGAGGTAYTAPQISEWKVNPGTTVPQTVAAPGPAPAQEPGYSNSAPAPQLNFNLNDVKQAQTWTVDPKTQTVAGQLESVLASDSPLLVQARTRALQRQNANGTLNSTMATSAADSAMYDAALQIATPDARTYGDAARFNADSTNQFAREGNAFTRQGYMADFNLRANDWAADRDFGRTSARDATMQQYNLDRDRIQNDFTLTRDEKTNALQVLRDSTAQTYNLARDTANNAFTTSRDTANNAATAARDTTANTNAVARDVATAATNAKAAATSRLYGARADFTTSVNALIAKDMGEVPKQQAIDTLKLNYNAIIRQSLVDLGWTDRTEWLIQDMVVTPTGTGSTGGTTAGGTNTGTTPDTAEILRNAS